MPGSLEALALKKQLFDRGQGFNFYQAVTLLERFHQGPRLGELGPVRDEAVNFRGHASMGFPAGDLAKVGSNKLGQFEIETNFIGLYGPSSPMPAYITESVISEQCSIEKENSFEFYMSSEAQVRSLRDGRLVINNQGDYAADIREKLKNGLLSKHYLEEADLAKIRLGVPLEQVVAKAKLEALRKGELVLAASERATARQRDFFDLYNHRLTSLLYRVWRKYRPELQYQGGAQDTFSQWLYSLMGAPSVEEQKDSLLYWPRLLGYIGLIGMRSRSVSVMCAVVSGYFSGIQVEVEEYVERWIPIPQQQVIKLGSANSKLSTNMSVGTKVLDRNGKFRVILGPLTFRQFNQFLPNTQQYQALLELVKFLMPEQLCFDIKLVLKSSEVPPLILGQTAQAQLGWSSWPGSTEGENQTVLLKGMS